jgi:large subunit ribosomal protein L21
MYVVVETSGHQFKCEEGETLRLDRIDGEVGKEVTFDRVLLARTDDGVAVGTPAVDGGKVIGTIVEHGKGPKGTAVNFKRRKGYHRRIGYRAHYTDVRIERIEV